MHVHGTEASLLRGHNAPYNPVSGHSKVCARVAKSSGRAEPQAATQAQAENDYVRDLWHEMQVRDVNLKAVDEQTSPNTWNMAHRCEKHLRNCQTQRVGCAPHD